jgi:peroxiredoxin
MRARQQATLALVLFLASAAAPGLEIGAAAPEFSVTPVSGPAFDFAEATRAHKAVVVIFLSVVCPYSTDNESHLRELDARYDAGTVLFVGVDSNRTETADELALHARRSGLRFPVMKDDANRVADLFGARATPEAFLFDQGGRLRYRGRVRSKQGSTDLADALAAVVAGREVRTKVAKAFGCTIVREPAPERD